MTTQPARYDVTSDWSVHTERENTTQSQPLK